MLDYYNVTELLSTEDRQIQNSARDYLDSEVMPGVKEWWESGEFPKHLVPEFGEMGFLGSNLPAEYGCPGVNNKSYGLIMYELERIDSGLRSFASVQSALVMYPIYRYGSEDQKKKYLPEMAKGNTIGCFGLTEHDGGSDPGAMKTNAKKDGESYILNGTKMWITNGNIADVALVWAKDETDTVRGFLVPTDTPGFTANKIEHKMSMRASVTSELVLEDVRVPATSILPESNGLSAPLSCLTQARYGIAWGALGALDVNGAVCLDVRGEAAAHVRVSSCCFAISLAQRLAARRAATWPRNPQPFRLGATDPCRPRQLGRRVHRRASWGLRGWPGGQPRPRAAPWLRP